MGIIDSIANLLGQAIKFLNENAFHNWGLSIIGITIIIKVILLPLTLKQDKSMREMKKIQPEVDKLREELKNKPEELNKRIMELYKEHKVNPFGGCFPVLFQLPILWALFAVLRRTGDNAVIPTDAIFLGFHLNLPDPYYVLPVLNGVIAFVQQKLMSANNSQSNKAAEKMMYFMPIMLFVISAKMPLGLQIYWTTSSFFSFAQQYFIMKKGDNKWVK